MISTVEEISFVSKGKDKVAFGLFVLELLSKIRFEGNFVPFWFSDPFPSSPALNVNSLATDAHFIG